MRDSRKPPQQGSAESPERRIAERITGAQRDLALALSGTSDMKEALTLVLDAALELTGLEAGGVYLLTPGGRSVDLIIHRGLNERIVSRTGSFGQGTPQMELVLKGEARYFEDLDETLDPEDEKLAEGLKSLAVAPVFHKGEPIGNINICSRRERKIGPVARNVLETFSALLGSFIARIRMENSLRDSEMRYKNLFFATPAAIVLIGLDGTILDYNGLEYAMGYSREETIGKHFSELPAIRKETLAILADGLAKMLRGEQVPRMEYEIYSESGEKRWFSTYISRYEQDGALAGFQTLTIDITETKNAEQFAIDNEKKFRLLFENTRDALFGADAATGVIMNCNRAAEQLMEKSRDEIIGLGHLDLHPPDKARYFAEMFRSHVEESGAVDAEAEVITASGKIIPVHISSNLTELEGRAVNQGIFRNIAALKASQEERELLMQQLYQSQKMEAIGQLAGGIAHDFNNILATILGSAQLMQRTIGRNNLDSERLDRIIKAGRRARDLTMKLLAFARKEKLNVQPVPVTALVDEILAMLEVGILDNIRIEKKLPTQPAHVTVDINMITQTLFNICLNGLDAMGEQGGTLTLEAEEVELDESFCSKDANLTPGPYCRITIRDTGAGIPEPHREKIFEPFFTTKERGKGTGLGLSVALDIVRSHNGRIEVASAPGSGTCVIIYLPVETVPASVTTEENRQNVSATSRRGTILIIDDETDLLSVMNDALEMEGFDVLTADCGTKAVEIYKHRRGGIDAVLLDMIMPDMDGTLTFREIRRVDPEAKIIICSGFSSEGKAGALLEQGAKLFLQKPLDILELSNTLTSVIQS